MASNKRLKTSLNPIDACTTCYQTPSLSAEIVANNDDLLTEILVRLPIKLLLAFKSVSKRWLALISNPHFCRRRTPLYKPNCGLFSPPRYRIGAGTSTNLVYDYVNLSSPVQSRIPNKPLRLSFTTDPMGGIKIMHSCNGLLLCSSHRGPDRWIKYYVYNPPTKHYTILPQLPVRSGGRRSIMGFSLAFDPSKSPRYKVVCVRSLRSMQNQLDFEIYSSEMGPWRLSSESFFSPISTHNLHFNVSEFWNGAVPWITTWDNWEAAGGLYFNVEKERLSQMPVPPLLVEDSEENRNQRNFICFGEYGDHLHLLEIYNPPSTYFNVYEMQTDYSGWFVKFRVDVAQVAERCILAVQDLYRFLLSNLICVVCSEVDEQSYMVMHLPDAIVKYYLKTNSLMKLCDIDDHYGGENVVVYKSWTSTYQYTESCLCVKI
ncbi:F-box protein At5g07610 [Ziziphus jujuba]|uniref:F-box protein At5g07610 n=2 Tax=Ziziphus jujuba TaxID=326968 RepID=A0A6P6FW48_ZIZJJ|nr:F-box protein At5g07610 [Ziziphus jujuba]KAH7541896.1 hypothetical protein FEM48_Zijuj02G0015900 [Ziziphus jujuba var. spinosa]